uniref:Reverse transcriptase domain-containing protein n=1 Tax=Tanacetum cinerariifolium TaxID=118510 RepID=A0A6L2NNH7_TANCI|nr:reverse transcriptase domain-containing protein [Tanacetum cinerariifolium]
MNLFMRHGKDQDSMNAAVGGNLLEKSPQDALTIIDNKSKQTSVVTTAMTAMLKKFQSNPPPAQVKAVEEICVTCSGAHPYYQCLAAGGKTFPEYRDNIQGYVSAATGNYNQGNPGYRPQGVANQMRPPGFAQPNVKTIKIDLVNLKALTIKRMNDVSLKAMQNQIDMVKNELRNEMKTSIQTSLSNQTNEIKNMMASFLQMNTASTLGSGTLPGDSIANPKGELKAITTRSGLVTEGPTVPNPPKSVNPEEDDCERRRASINLMPLSVWKKLGLPDLIPTRMTLELANRAICTPDGIARDVFVPVGKFTFPADFYVVDYESDPRVPLILGRPFLRTARALIDVHDEEMIFCDRDERLTLNMKHDTASYSNHPHRESVNLINIFNLSSEDCLEDLVSNKQSGNPTFSLHKEIASLEVIHEFCDSKGCTFLSEELPDIDSFNDIHPHFDDDPLSGSTTFSANSLLEEFADELALITYPPGYDDNRTCDIEFDIREIEFLLYQGEDSDFKGSIDQPVLTNRDDLFVDPTPYMFTDEQPPDYSFPLRFDVYPDNFLEIKSDADTFDNDFFDSKGEKIKESELLIDQLDLPCDILSEYGSFNSQDFSRDDVFPSPDNEDKVKENSKKDKIRSKPNKNGKRGEAEKSQKQLQWIEEEKLKKLQKEGLKMQIIQALFKKFQVQGLNLQFDESYKLEEEKARRNGKVYNWETATYGKIWYNKDVYDLRSVETEFPAIVFNETFTSDVTPSYEPTVYLFNDNKTEFRISLDESDDEDYTVIFDENLFSYKIVVVNNSKTDSKNDEDKVNIPELEVSYFDDLDFLKDFEKQFPAIVHNDALTSKSYFSTEPTLCPQHINEFNNETSLSECDEKEQNVSHFNDLFPFNMIYPDDLKIDMDSDNDKIDIEHSSGIYQLNHYVP